MKPVSFLYFCQIRNFSQVIHFRYNIIEVYKYLPKLVSKALVKSFILRRFPSLDSASGVYQGAAILYRF